MKYNLQENELIDIYADNFENIESIKSRSDFPLIILCSIIISFLYVQVEPASGSVNGFIIDSFVIYLIQLPLCFVITLFGLKMLKKLSIKKMGNKLKLLLSSFLNADDVGERELFREEGNVIFKSPIFEYKFKDGYITEIVERDRSFSILHDSRPLFSIHKRICTINELEKIIFDGNKPKV